VFLDPATVTLAPSLYALQGFATTAAFFTAVPAAPVVDVEKIRADARAEGARLERERLAAIDAVLKMAVQP
jgi:hypothetical protein